MNIFGGNVPSSLYCICLNIVGGILVDVSTGFGEDEAIEIGNIFLLKMGVRVTEDLMIALFWSHLWTSIASLFRTLKLSRLICDWNTNAVVNVKSKEIIGQLLITNISQDANIIDLLEGIAESCLSMDFDGELFWRQYSCTDHIKKIFTEENESWLSSSQHMVRYLLIINQRIPKYLSSEYRYGTLLELHLGTAKTSVEELVVLLRKLPGLYVLRCYKLVKALYQLHSKNWREGKSLIKYNLRNLDADFSYVDRNTLEVDPMLPLDALQLAVELCPHANTVRVRLDCSTHHDSLLPLDSLQKLKELSVVCVTNGERSLLTFDDLEPVLRQHGKKHLKSLELKVIEDVDTHKIVNFCPKLETLILSGCDYVNLNCNYQFRCTASNCPRLAKLKILFFAEGGDVISKNNVPHCFWYSTLGKPLHGERNKLTAVFLESPRISETVVSNLFFTTDEPLWPCLQVLSICDFNELTVEHLTILTAGKHLQFLRFSACQNLMSSAVKKWQKVNKKYNVLLYID